MIELVELIVRLTCDWSPAPCRAELVLRGCQTIADATQRARREGWSVGSANNHTVNRGQYARCPAHAYRASTPRTGRRPRAVLAR